MNSSVTSVGSHIVDDDLETTSPVIGATSNWGNRMLLSNCQSQSSTSVEGSVPCLEALNWSCSLPAAATMCDTAGQLPNTMSTNSTTRADSQQQLGTPANAFTDSTPLASSRSGGVAENRVWGEQGCCLSCPSGEIMHGSQNSSVEGLQDLPYPRTLVLPEELQKKMEEMLVWDLPPDKTFIFQGDGKSTATMEGAAPTLRYPQVVDDRSSSNVSTLPNVERWSAEEERRHCVSHTDPVNALTPFLEMTNSVQFDRSSVKQEYGSFRHSSTCGSSSNWTPMQDQFESWSSEQEHRHCVSQTDPVNAFTLCSEMPNAVQFDRNRVKHEYGAYGHYSPCTTSSNWTPAQSRYFRADEFNSNPDCSQLAIDQSGNQPLLTTSASDSCGVRWPPLRVHQKLPGAILQQRFRPFHSSLPSAQMIAFGNCLPWNLSDIPSFTPEAVRHAQGYGGIDRGFSLQSMQQGPFESKPLKGRIDTFQETPSDPKRNAGSMDTCETGSDGYLKRHCVEPTTPSLPLKQVRKEKLGDRITTLQQLVSPFGKTDTASVLFEAIAYIKFLQEQVQALSIPYMKSSCASSNQNEPRGKKSRVGDKSEDTNEFRHDLRSKGLCLVPLSCTIHVANDNGAEYWNPAYGVAFR